MHSNPFCAPGDAPFKLLQTALAWQLCVPAAHSLMSDFVQSGRTENMELPDCTPAQEHVLLLLMGLVNALQHVVPVAALAHIQ